MCDGSTVGAVVLRGAGFGTKLTRFQTWLSGIVLMTLGILMCFLIYKIRTTTTKIVAISEGCFEPVKALRTVLGT